MLNLILIVVISYFLGSLPSGFLVGRLSGIDIRDHGSGNIGATNVLRVLGKPCGFVVFFIDALKGLLAVRFALFLARADARTAAFAEVFGILAAAICIAGHSFPVWLKFRGGKGAATSAGAIFGVMPLAAAVIFAVWIWVFFTTRYVSVASIVGAVSLPFAVAVLLYFHLVHSVVLLYFSIATTVLVVWRHRSNIGRLRNGTEPRFTRK